MSFFRPISKITRQNSCHDGGMKTSKDQNGKDQKENQRKTSRRIKEDACTILYATDQTYIDIITTLLFLEHKIENGHLGTKKNGSLRIQKNTNNQLQV